MEVFKCYIIKKWRLFMVNVALQLRYHSCPLSRSPELNALGSDGIAQLLFSVELDGEVGQGSELRRLRVGLQMLQGL